MPNVCPRGAIQTGAAAEVAALSKERAWTAQAEAQGGTFYPLAIEAGGTLNARFHEFLLRGDNVDQAVRAAIRTPKDYVRQTLRKFRNKVRLFPLVGFAK